MDQLKGMNLDQLKAICRTVLADDSAEASKLEAKPTGKAKAGSEQEASGWTPAETTYVFVGTSDAAWPTTKPGRGRRVKQEESDAS